MGATNTWKMVALGIVILAVVISFLRKPENGDVRLVAGSIQESLGQVAADQAAKVLGQAGGKILLILKTKGEEATDPSHAIRAGFERGLKRHPNLSVAAVELGSNLSVYNPQRDKEEPSFSLYQRAVNEHPGVGCIVSFIPPPVMKAEEIQQWKTTMPKLISLSRSSGDESPSKNLMEQGILQVALVQTNYEIPEKQLRGPYQKIFEQFYKVVTAEKIEK